LQPRDALIKILLRLQKIMNGLLQDLRISFRVLSKSPGITAIAILALALGIGANTATFSGVRALVLNPLPFHDLDRVVRVWDTDPKHGFSMNMVSAGDYLDWRERSRSFTHLAAFNVWGGNITGTGEPERLQGAMVSPDLFPLLGLAPLLGRTFDRVAEQPGNDNVVVLSHGLWQRRYASDPSIVGRTISMNDRPFAVVGVMPREFEFPTGAELWVPLSFTAQNIAMRSGRYLFVVGRLRDGISIEQANSEMSAIAGDLGRTYPADQDHGVFTRRVREVTNMVTDRFVLVSFAAAAFVLLLGCANVTNLQLAQATARLREAAVCSALGASRWRIARQLLIENIILGCASGALGVLLGWWMLRLERASIPAQVYKWVAGLQALDVNPQVVIFSAVASVIAGVLCGLAPAWRMTVQQRLADALKEGRGAGEGAGHGRLRSALVVAEVALAAVLLVAAGLLVGAFNHMAQLHVGFDPRNLLTMQVTAPKAYREPEALRQYYKDVLTRVRALPQVRHAAAGNDGGVGINAFHISGQPTAQPGEPPPDLRLVTTGFFEAMGLPLIVGRTFTEQDAAQTPRTSLVISESVARYFWKAPGHPIGATAEIRPYAFPQFTIVGIVGDTRDWFTAAPDRTVYVLNDQMPQWGLQLAVRTYGDPVKALAAVRAQARGGDNSLAIYDAKTMEQQFDEELSGVRISTWMMSVFAAIALVLAASGVYGVVSYSVARRTHEIGVRMALGASGSEVLHHIIAQALRPVLTGAALGLPAAMALTRLMSSALYGVVELTPVTFIGVGLILVLSAVIAGYIPARRATKVDPTVALRYE
jgi:putative ABC transport system permease protein